MTVLGTDVLDQAMKHHADLRNPLAAWLKVAKGATWKNLVEVRQTWRDTDFVDPDTIFNVKGNSYRLYALVNYSAQTLIVREVITHAEYSKR